MDAGCRARTDSQKVQHQLERDFGRKLLAELNLTPQKPLQRAYQRAPEAIECWQRNTFPAIARQTKAEDAEIYFWNESGFRADAVQGKTWVSGARRRSLIGPVNAKASARPLRSRPVAHSGLPPTKAG